MYIECNIPFKKSEKGWEMVSYGIDNCTSTNFIVFFLLSYL